MEDKDKEGTGKKFFDMLPLFQLIIFSVIAFTTLIIRVASYSSDTSIEMINNVTEFSKDFKEASIEETTNYILLYWHDNMFIVAFGLFMAGLVNAVPLPKYVKLALYCSSIPAHPISDWIENTAALMALFSFNLSNNETVDEKWINQYFLWSKIKWAMLAVNVIAILFGFSLYLRNRCCKKSE